MLLAFELAPFAHVHTGIEADHEHSGLIHAHFYALHTPGHGVDGRNRGSCIDDDDDHASVQSVDTFTLVLTPGLGPFVLTRASGVIYAPMEISRPAEVIEERGHDPPSRGPSIPRAPPT